jgi:hypothetical protein
MGQFIRVNGDYNIKTREDGIIKFDTGPGVGQVVITGDLVVQGNTTTVEAVDLNIRDNLIVANFGEQAAGVTLQWSGLQVDRGILTPATIAFNENYGIGLPYWEFAYGDPGNFNYENVRLKISEIITEPSIGNEDGDLLLIGSGDGVIKVRSDSDDDGSDYQNNVEDPNDIPNKKYVDDAIFNNPTFQIRSDDTRVVVTDTATPDSLQYIAGIGFTTGGLLGEIPPNASGDSAISIIVDGSLVSQFYSNRAYIQDIEIYNNEITTNGLTNQNIIFRTQGTGKVEIGYGLQLNQIAGDPVTVSNATVLYAADPSVGESGVWFVNDSSEINKQVGELISKNKALVFSMLF